MFLVREEMAYAESWRELFGDQNSGMDGKE